MSTTYTETIRTTRGDRTVALTVIPMSAVEAIDVYDLPRSLYWDGGHRVEATVDDVPAGTRYYPANLDGIEARGLGAIARSFLVGR